MTLDICQQGKFIRKEIMGLHANSRDDWNGHDSEKMKQLRYRSDIYVHHYRHSKRTSDNIQVAPRKISAIFKEKIILAMKVILKSTEKCQERLSNIILGDLQKIYIQGPSSFEVDHLVHSS